MHVHTGNLLVAAMCMCHISVIVNRPERLDSYRWSASTSRTCSDDTEWCTKSSRSDPGSKHFLRPQQPQKSAYLSLHSRNPTLLRLRWDFPKNDQHESNGTQHLSTAQLVRWDALGASFQRNLVEQCKFASPQSCALWSLSFAGILWQELMATATAMISLSVFARTRLPPGWCETWE